MANAGSDVDDESWEEASDIFEVRSEADETEPEEPEVSVSDEEESTVIERPPASEKKQSSKSLLHSASGKIGSSSCQKEKWNGEPKRRKLPSECSEMAREQLPTAEQDTEPSTS